MECRVNKGRHKKKPTSYGPVHNTLSPPPHKSKWFLFADFLSKNKICKDPE